jgi:hypothetical protein
MHIVNIGSTTHSLRRVVWTREVTRHVTRTRFGSKWSPTRILVDATSLIVPNMSSSSSLTLSTLLSTLHTHLNAQTQLLPTLHIQLGLPQTALEDELQTLQHTLTKAVESQIEVRRKQVDDWIVKCEGVESGCTRYSRALGTHAKVAGSLSDLKAEKVLPRRYENATVYQEKLRQVSPIFCTCDLLG